MNSQKIFIYGVPGTGKTHYSKELGKELNLPVIEGDEIKRTVRKGLSKKDHPFLFYGTCQAYKEFGVLTPENAKKGLTAVRGALKPFVNKEIKKHGALILEGAFLDPHYLKKFGRTILLIVSDEKKHKKQFLTHREKMFDIKLTEFKAARVIQEYLIKEANDLGVELIEN